jgi:hypothetical protein
MPVVKAWGGLSGVVCAALMQRLKVLEIADLAWAFSVEA